MKFVAMPYTALRVQKKSIFYTLYYVYTIRTILPTQFQFDNAPKAKLQDGTRQTSGSYYTASYKYWAS